MGQCVMTTGTMKMPLSSAINWDSLLMVILRNMVADPLIAYVFVKS